MKVTSIQRSDKKLTCKDIILEINESEQYRQEAANAKAIGVGEALAPACWVTGYLDGEAAIKSANARIDYLGRIYELLDCSGDGTSASDYGSAPAKPSNPPQATPIPPAPPPVVVPQKPTAAKTPAEADMVDIETANKKGKFHDYFKELGGGLHAHKDAKGKVYFHSHNHSGPHRHLEDVISE
jgi:hypothetical protein